jgi:hypothetical protein
MSTTPTKFNRQFARAIVRVWPAESREWGQAFAAELPAVESASAATSWLIGGLMLLFREWLKHAWRALGCPIGSSADADSSASFIPRYSRTPRTPLWLMLALALSSAAILLHPEVRQSLEKLHCAYSSSVCWKPEAWSSVKQLREISKSNRDPHILALLSLLSADSNERLALSEEAIQKDPSLTWLDYEQSAQPLFGIFKPQPSPKERIERLEKWDPQNSVPQILAAELLAQPPELEQIDALLRGKFISDADKRLATNPDWISRMQSAFAAPKYDSYTTQAIELVRSVSSRFGIHDPAIAEYVLKTKRSPRFSVLEAYAQFVTQRGTDLEKAGHKDQAIAAYSEVLQFAQRAALHAQTAGEQFLARQICESACGQLVPLYASTGNANEASFVSLQLAQWKSEQDSKLFRNVPFRYRRWELDSLAWSGLLINIAGLLLVALVPLAFISILYVFARRKSPLEQRGFTDFVASLFADAALWLLLASSVLIYFTYHPYAKMAADFLRGGSGAPDTQTFFAAMAVPYEMPERFEFLRDPISQWSALIAVLCALLVFFLWRMMMRRAKTLT